jgi:hypothetical protein
MASRSVPAGNGWTWIVAAWGLFKKNPGMWIGITVVASVIFIAMQFVPAIGPLAAMVLTPVFVGGLMLGCRAQDQGGELGFDHLFAGFQQRAGVLVTVGVIYVVATIVIALAVGFATGTKLVGVLSGEVDPMAVMNAAATLMLAALLMLALLVPVFMALWFAPPLVVLGGRGAVAAMSESFAACMRNMMPFLIYSIVLFFFSILASIPLGLGWIILGPVLVASCYTAYQDIFSAEQPPAVPQPGDAR